jgi:hypothetical protein
MAAFRGRPFEWDVEEVPQPPDEGIHWDPHLYMVPQVYGWTCSACATDWVVKAAGLSPGSGDVYVDRETMVYDIGYTEQINPWTGLTNVDGPGYALQDVLDGYGQATEQAWLDFDSVYQLAQHTTGMMSGANWYHWVALRGVQGSSIWIANSAPGYAGIWDVLSREDFNRLGGFNVIWLVDD